MDIAERDRRFRDYLADQQGRLISIARVYAGQEADDLLQEILLQIWKSLDSFEDRSTIATWGYRIAINVSLQWRRSKGRKRRHLPSENMDVNQIARPDRQIDSAVLLGEFLSTLGATDKAVLLMHLDGLVTSDMSDVLGVGDGAVRVRLSRIKAKLADRSGEQL